MRIHGHFQKINPRGEDIKMPRNIRTASSWGTASPFPTLLRSILLAVIFCFPVGKEVLAEPSGDPTGDPTNTNYMSFVGDGAMPSILQQATQIPSTGGDIPSPISVSETGDAGYAFSLTLPAARFAPSMGVSYSSGGGANREMPIGWSISGIGEIIPAREPAFAGRDYYRISATFGSGLLVRRDGQVRYALQGTDGADISGEWDTARNAWTIWEGGREHTFEPVLGADRDYWRITHSRDAWGNEIIYHYTAEARISRITYGGNPSVGAPIVVRIRFEYQALAHPIYSNEHGKLETFGQALRTIAVDTDHEAEKAFRLAYQYDFHIASLDERDVLALIKKGRSEDLQKTVAEFAYQAWDPIKTSRAKMAGPFSPPGQTSESKTWKDAVWDPSPVGMNYQRSVMVDFNRDGLPDRLSGGTSDYSPDPENFGSQSNAEWQVTRLVRDGDRYVWEDPPLTFTGPASAVGEAAVEGLLNQPQTVKTIAKLADVDGDGYPDLIRSIKSKKWIVSYGRGTGFDQPLEAPAPWLHPEITIAPDANLFPNENESIRKTLIDLNGDGWIDCYEPRTGVYYSHRGYRLGGWSETPVSIGRAFPAFKTVDYTTRLNPVQLASGYKPEDAQRVIDETNETSGFYDLNADGWIDHITAESNTWRVSFGGPAGFSADVAWSSPWPYISRAKEGFPRTQYRLIGDPDPHNLKIFPEEPGYIFQTLVDVDGDRLPDLVTGFGSPAAWYHNTGTGFHPNPREAPAWWNPHFTRSGSSSLPTHQQSPRTGALAVGTSWTQHNVFDLDADGKQDGFSEDLVTWSNSSKSYLLIVVSEPSGRETHLGYQSSSQFSPVGDVSLPQSTPTHRTVIKYVTVNDKVTNESGATHYVFGSGVQIKGEFLGYRQKYATTYVNGKETKRTHTSYDLASGFPAVAMNYQVRYDTHLCSVPALAVGGERCTPYFQDMLSGSSRYDILGDQEQFKLPTFRSWTEKGEESGEATERIWLEWTDHGSLASIRHDGGMIPEDAFTLNVDYASNQAMGLHLPHHMQLVADDGRILEESYRYYDGFDDPTVTSGFMTRARTCIGPVFARDSACAEWAETTHVSGPRGQVVSTTFPTGKVERYRHAFGDSIVSTVTNQLGHLTRSTVDLRGRVTSVTNPGGVKSITSFDEFDRVLQERIAGRGMPVAGVLLRRHTYHDETYPNWHRVEDFAKNLTDTYEDFDGNGNILRTWRNGNTGYIRQDYHNDIRGLRIRSAYPVKNQPNHDASAPFSFAAILEMNYHDGLGRVRESYRDFQNQLGHMQYLRPTPRVTKTIDGEGYVTEHTRNAHGQLTHVRNGKSGPLTETGTFQWDPTSRLRTFTTAMGDAFEYVYDTAGRLRTVKKGVAGQPLADWHVYTYHGALPYRREDNAGQYTTYAFDEIRRLTSYTVSDPLAPSGHIQYVLEYDPTFPSNVRKTTDERGTESMQFDPYGREVRRTRHWSGATPLTKSFQYGYAQTGELEQIVYPSGTTMALVYGIGLLGQRVVTNEYADPPTARIFYSYNPSFLQLNQVRWGELIFDLKRRTSPLRIDQLIYTFNSHVARIDYGFLNNGMVSAVTFGGELPGGTHHYRYDDLAQLTRVTRLPGANIFQAGYHADGSLASYTGVDGRTYAYSYQVPPTDKTFSKGLRRPFSRRSGDLVDTYVYDPAGRRTSTRRGKSRTRYEYDGLGRVRRVQADPSTTLVYHYNANGEVIEEVLTRASGGTTTYRLKNWRLDWETGFEEEDYSRVVSARTLPGKEIFDLIWKFPAADRQVVATYRGTNNNTSTRRLAPFGEILQSSGRPWQEEAFHGARYAASVNLLHMGARHMPPGDGHWLQPEPLLYLGPHFGNIGQPLKLAAYRYAGNDPVNFNDLTGLGNDSFDWDDFLRSGESPEILRPKSAGPIDPKARVPLTDKEIREITKLWEDMGLGVLETSADIGATEDAARVIGKTDAYFAERAQEVVDDVAKLTKETNGIAPDVAERARRVATRVLNGVTARQAIRVGLANTGSQIARAGLTGAAEWGLEAGAAVLADSIVPGAGAAVEAAGAGKGLTDTIGSKLFRIPMFIIMPPGMFDRPEIGRDPDVL